jgi:hypothetical protein
VSQCALLITGGRDRTDPNVQVVLKWLDPARDLLIVGDCPTGIDAQARHEAARCGLTPIVGIADWTTHGKRAGMLRNGAMVACLAALRAMGWDCAVVAFPGAGPGTRNCIEHAQSAGFAVGIL